MKMKKDSRTGISIVLFIFLLCVILFSHHVSALEQNTNSTNEDILTSWQEGASLFTDKNTYYHGETVIITMHSISLNATINLTIISPNGIVFIAMEEKGGMYSFTETSENGEYRVAANLSTENNTWYLVEVFNVIDPIPVSEEINTNVVLSNLNNISLWVDKTIYKSGTAVRFNLTAPPEIIKNFSILSPEMIFYTILPTDNGEYEFIPDSPGKYVINVSLENESSEIFLTAKFKVLNKHDAPSLLTAKKKHFGIGEKPEFIFDYENDGGSIKDPGPGKNATDPKIKSKVYDHNGKLTDIQPQVEKLQEGKFSIKLPKERGFRAGVYTLEVEFIKDGYLQTQELEFQWGLVSLNTRKSIYKPGEIAEFIIVVLDKYGHPVSNADISMNVTDPDNKNMKYSTGSRTISSGIESGIYNANYPTEIEGDYTMNITALIDGVEVIFNTYFLVKEEYEFDIIRTAKSKIDPNIQDSFDVRLDIESDAVGSSITIHEFVPAIFEIYDTDAKITNFDSETKILTWKNYHFENRTSVTYSYSIPPIWPYLYTLGPAEIEYTKKTFTEARPWFIAVDPAPSMILISDTTPPLYSNISRNNTEIGLTTLLSAYWTDLGGFTGFNLSTNNSGIWTNTSYSMTGTGNWSNATIILNSTPGLNIGWRIYAKDTSGNWNDTGIQTILTNDTTPPIISDINFAPDPQFINFVINITANITDIYQVNAAYINITFPNSTTTGNFSMTKNAGDVWYYNYTPPVEGLYNFTIFANDTSDNWNSFTGNFTAKRGPDFQVTNIVFTYTGDESDVSETGTGVHIKENTNITVNATIRNYNSNYSGDYIYVGFYDGSSGQAGRQFRNVTLKNATGGSWISNNTDYYTITYWDPALVGTHNISVWVDWTNVILEESNTNERNNNKSKQINVSSWQKYWGNTSGKIVLADPSGNSMMDWSWSNDTDIGNIYIVNSGISVNWTALHGLGCDRNNALNLSGNDFSEADTELNLDPNFNNATGFINNNITQLFSSSDPNNATNTTNFIIQGINLTNVPIANSSNMTDHNNVENANFITGILWDQYSGSQVDYYDGSQDLIFVGKIQPNSLGLSGITEMHNYEIGIPSVVNTTMNGNIDFYLELQ